MPSNNNNNNNWQIHDSIYTSNNQLEFDQPWSDYRHSHKQQFQPLEKQRSSFPIPTSTSTSTSTASTSTSTSRYMDMSIPSISLDSSWRSNSILDPDPRIQSRQNGSCSGKGTGREMIWDIQNFSDTNTNTNNGLDALGLSINDHSSSTRKGKNKDDNGDGKASGGEPLSTRVLAKVMDTGKGRDKVLKCIQYSARTYLYLLSLIVRIKPLPPWFKSNRKRMKLAMSGLSMTRTCLLFLNPLHPLSDLLSHEPMSPRTLVGHLYDLIAALADDICVLAKLGFIGRRVGNVADTWAGRFWFLSTLMALHKLHFKTIPKIANSSSSLEKRRNELNEAKWSNRKLLADLAFVSYDVFELDYPVIGEPMKCFTGLLSALIGAFKLYNQEWDASMGKG